MKTILCTECYIQKAGKTLMLHRNRKPDDINYGKWIGVGGKLNQDESPEQCLLREVNEETGLTLTEFTLRGLLTFVTLNRPDQTFLLFIYTASAFTGEVAECGEGTLEWIDDDKILDLTLWEGDRLLWDWLQKDGRFFSAKFVYDGPAFIEHDVKFYQPCR